MPGARYGSAASSHSIGEPVRRGDAERLARNIAKALEIIKEKPFLAIVAFSTIELYWLTS